MFNGRGGVAGLVSRHLPKSVVYHCGMRLVAYATTGWYGNTATPELTAVDALKRWEPLLDSPAEARRRVSRDLCGND